MGGVVSASPATRRPQSWVSSQTRRQVFTEPTASYRCAHPGCQVVSRPFDVQNVAQPGTAGGAGRLPDQDGSEQSLGLHDVEHVQSHRRRLARRTDAVMGLPAQASQERDISA